MKGHEGEIVSLDFSSDCHRLISGSFDYTAKVIKIIQIWDLKSG